MKNIDEAYNSLYKINYGFNDDYGLSFLTPNQYIKIKESLSYLRRCKELDSHEYYVLCKIFEHQYKNYSIIRELIFQEPRKMAQKFIGRKKIREFIFKRDNYKCLDCGTTENLTLDHIHSIYFGGENKLSNLQTLCKGCNSYKSINFKDFR